MLHQAGSTIHRRCPIRKKQAFPWIFLNQFNKNLLFEVTLHMADKYLVGVILTIYLYRKLVRVIVHG